MQNEKAIKSEFILFEFKLDSNKKNIPSIKNIITKKEIKPIIPPIVKDFFIFIFLKSKNVVALTKTKEANRVA